MGFGAGDLGGWLTLPEAAQRYGLTEGFLRQAADDGRIAVRRVGDEGRGPWLVQLEQIDRLLEEAPAGHVPARSQADAGASEAQWEQRARVGGGSTRAAGSEGSAVGRPELRNTDIVAGGEIQQAPPSPKVTGTHQ